MDTQEIRHCKKCNKELPVDYQDSKCEACVNVSASNSRKMGEVAIGILGVLAIGVKAFKNKI